MFSLSILFQKLWRNAKAFVEEPFAASKESKNFSALD